MANAVQAAVAPRVEAIAEPLARSLGLELVDVEYLREGPSWIVRVFIDKPGGVNLDDCSALSHALGTALDVDEVVGTAYSLEVSSPGLERPLKKSADFERFAGKRIKVKTFAPLASASGQKNFQGILRGLAGDQVEIEVDSGRDAGATTKAVRIPLSAIAKAHLVVEI
jgi:ribosome maturation factor RimP